MAVWSFVMPFIFRWKTGTAKNTQGKALPGSVPERVAAAGTHPASGAVRALGLPGKWLLTVMLALMAWGAQADQAGREPALSVQRKADLVRIFGEALRDKDITPAQYEQSIAWVHATPCAGVDRSLGAPRQALLEAAVAKKQAGKKTRVRESFRSEGWFILQTEPADAELHYFFYDQDPIKGSQSVTDWGGFATVLETTEVAQWVKREAPGIGDRLADCFAWHVTLNRK